MFRLPAEGIEVAHGRKTPEGPRRIARAGTGGYLCRDNADLVQDVRGQGTVEVVGNMALGHVSDLVGHNPGELADVPRLDDRAGVDVDVAGGRGESVDLGFRDDMEAVGEGLRSRVFQQPPADGRHVSSDGRVVDEFGATIEVTGKVGAQTAFLVHAQGRARRRRDRQETADHQPHGPGERHAQG